MYVHVHLVNDVLYPYMHIRTYMHYFFLSSLSLTCVYNKLLLSFSYACTCTYTCTNMYMYCTRIYMYTYIHVHVYLRIYTHVHVHVYTCTYNSLARRRHPIPHALAGDCGSCPGHHTPEPGHPSGSRASPPVTRIARTQHLSLYLHVHVRNMYMYVDMETHCTCNYIIHHTLYMYTCIMYMYMYIRTYCT